VKVEVAMDSPIALITEDTDLLRVLVDKMGKKMDEI
jgi:hypothetical protein